MLQTLPKGAAILAQGARYCSVRCVMKMYLSGTSRLRPAICGGSGSWWFTVCVAPKDLENLVVSGREVVVMMTGRSSIVDAIWDAMEPTPWKILSKRKTKWNRKERVSANRQ